MTAEDPQPTLWRPLAVVALFALLPFAAFLNDNRAELGVTWELVAYAAVVFAVGAAIVLLARARGRARAGERAAVVYAVGAYVFFKFTAVRDLVEALGAPPERPIVALAAWVPIFAVAVLAASRLGRHPLAWRAALVAGALLTALPILQYASYRASQDGETDATAGAVRVPAADRPAGERPDVFVFLLDAYGREDQLRRVLDFDNRPFLGALEERGFDVVEDARSAYAMTTLSIASLFAMDYPADGGRLEGRDPYIDIIEGENPVIGAFSEMDYRLAFAPTGLSAHCPHAVEVCMRPGNWLERRLGQREFALLDSTPLGPVADRLGVDVSTAADDTTELPPPETVRRARDGAGDRPVFLYSHHLVPHAPYRYEEDCSTVETPSGTLTDGGQADGEGGRLYVAGTRCVNDQLLEAIDAILARDRPSVIVLASDHGPGFGVPWERSPASWSDDLLRQRMSVLSAVRLPAGCDDAPLPRVTVNIFRTVLTCVTGRPLEPLAPRHLASNYDEDAELVAVPERALR